MLNLAKDRLDYGELLRPPPGCRLQAGIATTFTLDLDTLLAASLALEMSQTLEGETRGEHLAFLNSLGDLQGRLEIHYQAGRIKIPRAYNRLYGLLEPLLVAQSPATAERGNAAFASFHPKVWLLRFGPAKGSDQGAVVFRLLVLSRNITGDRSWDIAVKLEGRERKSKRAENQPLIEFSKLLSEARRSTKATVLIDELLSPDLLGRISWDAPARFSRIAFRPGFPSQPGRSAAHPLSCEGEAEDVLVVSPFVDAGQHSFLQSLAAKSTGKRVLISRQDTLNRLPPSSLEGWEVLRLASEIVDGEEMHEQPDAMPQELHAKLVVIRRGTEAEWQVGSANMTDAATGSPETFRSPRNVEFMLQLAGLDEEVGPARLLQTWRDASAVVPHIFQPLSDELPPEQDRKFRECLHLLATATWQVRESDSNSDQLDISLKTNARLESHCFAGFRVQLALLSRPLARQPVATTMTWTGLSLTEISAIFPVEIHWPERDFTHRFSIQAVLPDSLVRRRNSQVIQQMVGSPERLVSFLTLLLQSDASKSSWAQADRGASHQGVFGEAALGGLYESLLSAATKDHDRLRRVIGFCDRLEGSSELMPPGLKPLLNTFRMVMKEPG